MLALKTDVATSLGMLVATAVEQNKEKRMKRNEDSLRDLWDNIKRTKFAL